MFSNVMTLTWLFFTGEVGEGDIGSGDVESRFLAEDCEFC